MAPKTYNANCHCGAVRYTVKLDEALAPEGTGVIGNCNCSICTKNGYLLVYPRREDVKWLQGEDKLKDHYFGRKIRPHRFCSECGSSILIDLKNHDDESRRSRLAVNTRMFEDIDYENVIYSKFDGKTELEPKYSI